MLLPLWNYIIKSLYDNHFSKIQNHLGDIHYTSTDNNLSTKSSQIKSKKCSYIFWLSQAPTALVSNLLLYSYTRCAFIHWNLWCVMCEKYFYQALIIQNRTGFYTLWETIIMQNFHITVLEKKLSILICTADTGIQIQAQNNLLHSDFM
jgi:hypothetical protein